MRVVIITALLLVSGCSDFQEWHQRRINAAYAASAAKFDEVQARLDAEWAQQNSPEGKAEAICAYRARAAVAGRSRRALIDLEGEAIAAQLLNECKAIYLRTGEVP